MGLAVTADHPLMASTQAGREEAGADAGVLNLSITVLHIEVGLWCDACGVPSAMTVFYTVELATAGRGGCGR